MKAMAKGGQSKVPGRMESAWASYDAGDVVRARRAATAVLADAPTDQERAEVADLLRRAGLPREGLYLGGLTAVLILLSILLGVARG